MSAAAAVLDEAALAGVPLRLDEAGRLKVRARPSEVPPALLARLREHKAELTELLRLEANRPGDAGPCPACGYHTMWRVPPGTWRCCRCEPCEAALAPGAVFEHRTPEPVPGDRCRRCGAPIVDARPDWLAFADGSAAHVACEDAWAVADVIRRAGNARSPEALADEAELVVRGEPLP